MKKLFNTEIAALGVWDGAGVKDLITCKEDYDKYIVSDFGWDELAESGRAILWDADSDGKFEVDIRVESDKVLSEKEQSSLQWKIDNTRLRVTGEEVYVGAPEGIGSLQEEEATNGYISKIEGLSIGEYEVNIYFLFEEETGTESFILMLNSIRE